MTRPSDAERAGGQRTFAWHASTSTATSSSSAAASKARRRTTTEKSFLKWAGGKHRIADRILAALPERRVFVEPFVGSGAVFLATNHETCILADVNPDLIALYRTLKSDPSGFVESVRRLFVPENNSEEAFYALRSEFNATSDLPRRAALFVYLNRYGFNGLCRYNAKGAFNVPFGRYAGPYFPEKELRTFAAESARATFACADFRDVMAGAPTDAVVYCDPPYVPLSATASFSDYAKDGFGIDEQRALADEARKLRARGIPVVISNHDTDLTRELYAGAHITSFDVHRAISAKGATRGKVRELVAVFA